MIALTISSLTIMGARQLGHLHIDTHIYMSYSEADYHTTSTFGDCDKN